MKSFHQFIKNHLQKSFKLIGITPNDFKLNYLMENSAKKHIENDILPLKTKTFINSKNPKSKIEKKFLKKVNIKNKKFQKDQKKEKKIGNIFNLFLLFYMVYFNN